jgi:hypothetical protein
MATTGESVRHTACSWGLANDTGHGGRATGNAMQPSGTTHTGLLSTRTAGCVGSQCVACACAGAAEA